MTKGYNIQQILLDQLSISTSLLSSYTSLGLDEKEVMVLIQIHRFAYEGNFFPTPFDIASCMSVSEDECSKILRKLVRKQFLTIEKGENAENQVSEVYSLETLWKNLYDEKLEKVEEEHFGTIFVLFEQEFGRPISPFEIEMINAWIDEDQIAPSLIKAGLREAVLMGKLNFKYIDRILRDWQKKGIQTVEQARDASRTIRQTRQTNTREYKEEATGIRPFIIIG
ncbi:DnaD domain-containing protein [Paracerasibacillus soli]|uniref:DnaD domain-containing protein n=1 Tax=Paracerasibacillus soli TaxID=480284 RepID=A0ABU5CR09_9BACI|nr:DnaD domain-containing protein [Virgibacillus soli]MDY0408296.1 DnaD domain-containing protein [Virgibacillus soli]